MHHSSYLPPWGLRNGISMTVYTALKASRRWQALTREPEPIYQPHVFQGAGNVPIYGEIALPQTGEDAAGAIAPIRGTIVATYGITGTLENQWFLQILGRKAVARGYAIARFDWRAHGKTAQLSPTLTSDGLYEGEDFVQIAAQSKALGCPPPFWLMGYSLGGQLALWGVKAAQGNPDIGGAAVICPSLDSRRSLTHLVQSPLGRYLEKAITRQLKKLAWELYEYHPESFDRAAISRAHSIWTFDQELVIGRLGFSSVEEYYDASSALPILPHLSKPTLILYAADDPMFDPAIVPDLQAACAGNSAIALWLTEYGGHVGYLSSKAGQRQWQDQDPWWAWNRILDWCDRQVA